QALTTLVHASLGVQAFGVAPGNGLVMATLRAINNDIQNELMEAAKAQARHQAQQHRLGVEFSNGEKFAACTNNPQASAHVERATAALGLTLIPLQKPFRWSEDFGLFSDVCQSALFVLGAGEEHPQLHNPDYDFPDELIATGVTMFVEIARQLCGKAT
ncbi:MAG: M20/M25/M40 family metallo-hydrolase, partial [Ahrensia sp.]